jgi:4,5-dihydroxyphthalate decarboxylase
MLVTGEIDAFTAQVPLPYVKRAPQIKRLFSDPRLVEAEHFRRTGIFPIMHVMVIREEFYRRLLGLPKVFTKHYSNRRGIVSRRSIEMTPSIQCFPGLVSTLKASGS